MTRPAIEAAIKVFLLALVVVFILTVWKVMQMIGVV
jgi:hypothetical protein